MNKLRLSVLGIALCTMVTFGQSETDIINQVNLDSLVLTVNEFSGEQSTVVYGNTVTILNRQQANNDTAADYLKQTFEQWDNLTVTDQAFNANGRNIVATQLGTTNPDNIYIICAHYDSVADYCADDNASGVATVLEIARILSSQCLDNTIVYALWDEEENGLQGSGYYANLASENDDNILGVLNIDMMGYDGNNDNHFDIDVRDFGNSLSMSDDIVALLSTYDFNLNENVVNPGTLASDHSRFWDEGYSAVLVGESWETNDQTPYYHSSLDRISTLNLPYYHELAKLIMAYMVSKGGLTGVDSGITQTESILTVNETGVTYQWYDCDTDMPIDGAVFQSFMPSEDGNYSVEVTNGDCVEFSECISFNTLGMDAFLESEVKVHPNPVLDFVNVEVVGEGATELNLYDISGKLVLNSQMKTNQSQISLKHLSKGIYLLEIHSGKKSGMYKIVKK
ncbi:M28 family peptidase [Mangrovimonas sp. YM274]|uniref:M28 family peptidase n=1 Tax=Mangrovimonas sp. YM274 TaxID=3070660 RepID=UPI0027DDE2D9|nr:M28 family peptidase [Mangrovimonas sp. YM274]WMI68566.1 M28 family peptidase [Mangrovimonas sp. YM274]